MTLGVVPFSITERSELIPPFAADERCRVLLDVRDEFMQSAGKLVAMISSENEARKFATQSKQVSRQAMHWNSREMEDY